MITNRLEGKTVYSNCVYPDWTNSDIFKFLGTLDKDYVEDELERLFECNSIANKYAIQVGDKIWYQHDFKTYLLEQKFAK